MLKTPLKTLLDILINHFTKERLVTLIIEHDEKLLTFMLENENANDYKNAFFKTIANSLVFNEKALLECLEIKELEKSFTRFKNKIGLYSQGGFLKSSGSVVLHFPFKDNVLLGNAKDNSTKSDELFYHEILHKNEIDVLLSPKVLCRFEMHGQGDLKNALKDENTNYLIKGNNLIALHSLKKKFAKKVKCIYIDPPYNMGNDSFNYNDNFNHSSWLVFMKNRLEAAREFLSDDGVIFVQCDDNEQAYLKVLMDEVFLRENFVASISWKQFHSVKNDATNFSKNIEYILCYCKNFSKNLISNEPFDKSNLYKLKDENGFYKLDPVWAKSGNNFSPYTFLNGKTWSPPSGAFWRYSIGTLKDMEQNNRIVFNGKNPMAKRYLSEVAEGRKSSTFWDGSEVGYNLNGDAEIKQLFSGNKVFNNPKPEALLQRILEISTKENDLVCDFFAGSGTTCAVSTQNETPLHWYRANGLYRNYH
ncbi:site-specific DNA-methyltransferase [Helicobacter pylori]|uniref:site-specific DNA-methyltransferase n=1 Tax=Helicobacter pylori TaxID=210 RepID=UPI00026B40DE|nr:adenine-specific DNA-methyltransferase [Helicobacter pylori Hp P-41]